MTTSSAIVAAGDVHDATSTELVAVGDVRTHLPPAEELLAIKKLATQTKAIGIILPPPDIRAIIDKTSQFVAKHGQWPQIALINDRGCNECIHTYP
jgi:splicing factor 3A subunit 1